MILSLALFMAGIVANDTENTLSADDLAFLTDFSNGCPDFHGLYLPWLSFMPVDDSSTSKVIG